MTPNAASRLRTRMGEVQRLTGYQPEQDHPAPHIEHRDDMDPIDALWECYDLWSGGAWPDENAPSQLREIEMHLEHLARKEARS